MRSNEYYLTVKVESAFFQEERYFHRQRGIITYLRRINRLHRTIITHESKKAVRYRWSGGWTKQDAHAFARKHPLKVSVIPDWKMEDGYES
jgi:hypothetical protein